MLPWHRTAADKRVRIASWKSDGDGVAPTLTCLHVVQALEDRIRVPGWPSRDDIAIEPPLLLQIQIT
jgi:hypothetical protein